MPQRDKIHYAIRQALVKEGWEITDDPYVISYGERFLFIDLAANTDSLTDGELVISKLSLKLLIVDIEMVEVRQWIPPRQIETL